MGDEVDRPNLAYDSQFDQAAFSRLAPMAARFGLANQDELDSLIDRLIGYSCRDQEERWVDASAMAKRRAEGYLLAKLMRDEAAAMLVSLDKIHSALNRFTEEVVRFHPPLLEAIFNVTAGGPENLFLPPEVDILQTFFPANDELEWETGSTDAPRDNEPELAACPSASMWDGVDAGIAAREGPDVFLWDKAAVRLASLAAIPVREQLPKGPVPNVTLRKALADCREYWCTIEGRSWTMNSLKAKAARSENVRDNLKGKCEQFVVAVLAEAGINFSLSDLCSNWTAVDAARA